jgi:small-conductance mechanosensitive channel
VSIIFYVVGLAVVLSLFDVSLLPAITALGVGGLAVALAFQDTLANLFSGIYITLSQQIRIGDYVEISPTEQGFVYDIGWRATTLQTLASNLVIIPNKKFAESTMTNYTLPETELSVELSVGVSYNDDPQRVEEVLIDLVHKASGEVQGVLDKPPAIRFTQFGDFSLAVFAYVRVDKVENRYAARHELMKRVYHRFREEGIQIPFPIRTIQFADDNGDDKSGKLQKLVGSGRVEHKDSGRTGAGDTGEETEKGSS